MSSLTLEERIDKLERFTYGANQDSLPNPTEYADGEEATLITDGGRDSVREIKLEA